MTAVNQKQLLKGFTLLELLVAMAVFAALAVAAYGSLNSVLKTRDHTSKAAVSLQRLQMGMTILQRDFMQLTDTSARDEYGDLLSPFITPSDNSNLLEFTHSGWNNPTNQPRSNLQRVAYELEDNTLYREYWPQLQPGSRQEPVRAILLEDIEEVEFEFLDRSKDRWHAEWPPLNSTSTDLPVAVRLTITFTNETEIVRLFGINQ
ncbi:MAG: type II secretion system minor pseudopilin GspJ [Gammaproteobacteria bacterium]|nr:type II secretion system minor pseudopilin GspJ [Gammaproteobacteria bacterium]